MDEQKEQTHTLLVHLCKFLVQAELTYSDRMQISDNLGQGSTGGKRTQGTFWEWLVS